MKAELTVTRTPYNVEQSVTLSVELDKDGDVFAFPMDSQFCKREVFNRYLEGYETIEINLLLCRKDRDFELTDEELEEAKKAIASNQAAYDAKLKGWFRDLRKLNSTHGGISPLAGLSPHESAQDAVRESHDAAWKSASETLYPKQ